MDILIALGHAGYREVDLQMAGEVDMNKLLRTEREISGEELRGKGEYGQYYGD